MDVFENPEYIYIVLEHMAGGDLFAYLERRDFKITEDKARSIAHQIASALYYLHSYGIVHRDLKLENILMVDMNNDSELKLVDFGLSKILGPNETSTDPFGTLVSKLFLTYSSLMLHQRFYFKDLMARVLTFGVWV